MSTAIYICGISKYDHEKTAETLFSFDDDELLEEMHDEIVYKLKEDFRNVDYFFVTSSYHYDDDVENMVNHAISQL